MRPPPRLLDLLLSGQLDLQADILEVLEPRALHQIDAVLPAADVPRVHLVLADATARKALERAATAWAGSMSDEGRPGRRYAAGDRGGPVGDGVRQARRSQGLPRRWSP